MTPETPPRPGHLALFRNWLSLAGGILAIASIFAFVLLMAMDFVARDESPYIGILTYLVVPAFLTLGLMLVFLGWFVQRMKLRRGRPGAPPARAVIDLSRPRDRKIMGGVLAFALVFLMITAVSSYQAYHVTKSVAFCGETCHSVMHPQYVTAQHSPHARVACTECHVAPGAGGFVASKFNGLNQVFATLTGTVKLPISHDKVKIDQRTCEQCHWPQRYVGNLEKTFMHYLDDEENTPYAVRLLLKVGGGDPTHGPVGGIHWHMNVGSKVEYIATDDKKQNIPWVRVTHEDGEVVEYRVPSFKDDISKHRIRTMDCMDCHNRPAHHFRTPNDAVDLAISLGKISTDLPSVKRISVVALTQPYANTAEGLTKIAESMREAYGNHPEAAAAIAEVQNIYRLYFFPEMKTDWTLYPNNIGHKDWPGCFRCHGGDHVSHDGTRRINHDDCNACHIILAEGSGPELDQLNARGLEFKHPEEGWKDMRCSDCHTGRMD
jgi:hypothetical protein